jgi:hypothetical protein
MTTVPKHYGAAQLAVDRENEHAMSTMMEAPLQSFKEAMNCPNADCWMATMVEEIESITKHKVW